MRGGRLEKLAGVWEGLGVLAEPHAPRPGRSSVRLSNARAQVNVRRVWPVQQPALAWPLTRLLLSRSSY